MTHSSHNDKSNCLAHLSACSLDYMAGFDRMSVDPMDSIRAVSEPRAKSSTLMRDGEYAKGKGHESDPHGVSGRFVGNQRRPRLPNGLRK
jgi:hypothetical protein